MPRIKPIKVVVIGAGNCFASFLQGLYYYAGVSATSPHGIGLIHNTIGPYLPQHLKVVAVIDVNADKVGKDISEAIWIPPNNARRFCEVPLTGVKVSPGFIGDGVPDEMRRYIPRVVEDPERVVEILRRSGATICIILLPTASESAMHFYVSACLEAGISVINAIPALLDHPIWGEFEKKGLAYAGHDMMSQVGATILNIDVAELIVGRGGAIDEIVQMNYGNDMDFRYLMLKNRISAKALSKASRLARAARTRKVIAGPGSYKESLSGDRKEARITIKARQFGDVPISIEILLKVDDSPNAGAVLTDVARLMQLWLDRAGKGYLPASEWYFKYPRYMLPLPKAKQLVKDFISSS